MYDDLKELEGEVADKAEAYLEEMFPGIAHDSDEHDEQDEELAVEEAVDQDFLDASKPLEHADETEPVAEAVPSIAKGGHHRNGTHHSRPGHKHKHKHNSTHGNDTETPVFEPERYFTEPLITGLLVTFLVFIPLIAMGIAALSSIQVRSVCSFGKRSKRRSLIYVICYHSISRYRLTSCRFPRPLEYRSPRRSSR